MRSTRIIRSSTVLVTAVGLAAVLVGGILAAQLAGSGDPEALVSAIGEDRATKVADIAAEPGHQARSVFVQTTSTGHVCLWDAPSATSPARQGGCNSAEDPLGGRELSVSFAYDGGPAPSTVTDARLIGLGAADVADVEVLMSDGTRRTMHLRTVRVGMDEYRAFGYRFKRADLRRGVGPTAVIAFDASGAEIDRQTTGFTG